MRLPGRSRRRRVPPRSLLRLTALLGALSLVLAFAVLPDGPGRTSAHSQAPAAAPQAPGDDDADPTAGRVSLSLDALSPEILRDGEDLHISGTLVNGTDDPVPSPSLATQVQERTEITTAALSLWLAEERDTSLSDAVQTPVGQDLAPGQRASFSVTLSADELPLSESDQWGPRGIQVALTDGGATLAQDRSIIVWDPGASVEPMGITTVVPVTASPEELAVLTVPEPQAADPESLTSIRERVTGLLEMAGDGVVLAVDPALTQALGIDENSFQGTRASPTAAPPGAPVTTAPDPAQGSGTPSPPPSDQSSQSSDGLAEMISALTRAIAKGEVVALPWDDVDVAAMAHTRSTATASSAAQRAQSSTLVSAGAGTSVSWPASSELDAPTLDALPESTTTVIAPAGSMPVAEDLTYTPSGVTGFEGRTVLLPDEDLSLAISGRLPEDLASPQSQRLSDLDARQLLRGQTAIIARQAPVLRRDLVVSLDRGAAAALDPATVRERVEALQDTSWTTGSSMSDLVRLVAQDRQEGDQAIVERIAPPQEEVIDDAEVPAETLIRAREAGQQLGSVSSVLSSPASALGRHSDVESVIASAAWRADPTGRSAHIDQALAAGDSVTSSLTAAPSSTINIINSEAVLPVRIVSTLDQDATVHVRLISDSQRLQIPETATVEVPARGEGTAKMPVTAVGSGEVNLTVQVLAADGTPVGRPSTVHLQVRADWESVGTAVIGVGLLLILVVGVVRTVRRGRRTTRTALPPAVQEHA